MKNVLTIVAMAVILGGFYVGGRYVYDLVVEGDRPATTAASADGAGQRSGIDQERLDAVDLPVEFVSVGSGPDQCPGFTANLPRDPLQEQGPQPGEAEDGRVAGTVQIADGSFIIFACLARQDGDESVEMFVDRAVAEGEADTSYPELNRKFREPFPESRPYFKDVIRLDSETGKNLLTDRYFEHDGWLFAVGLLQPREDEGTHDDVLESVLASVEF